MTEKRYVNRELSWLQFNARVLDEARSPDVPLLDRLFFLTITASNLDEFFMVRVGGLTLMKESGSQRVDISGMNSAQQLKAVKRRARQMMQEQYESLDALRAELAAAGIRITELSELRQQDINLFNSHIRDLITPMNPSGRRKLHIDNQRLYVACRVNKRSTRGGKEQLVLIPLGKSVQRVYLQSDETGQTRVILAGDLVRAFADSVLPGCKVLETAILRVTRNADVELLDEYAADLATAMRRVLRRRVSGNVVRLEVSAGITKAMRKALMLLARIEDEQDLYEIPGPLDLTGLRTVCDIGAGSRLKRPRWQPQESPVLAPRESIFDQIRQQDIPIALPYESFDPIIRFLDEAASDPHVLAIKVVLYRASQNSPIIAALHRAAESNKYVTALVELKARFDEANNLRWARRLEEAGVQVIYGIRGLKTHAKICLVVRREEDGLRRYVHFGTGNYNESTAKLYTDVGFLTSQEEYGADASAFFNAICGDSEPQAYRCIRQAPLSLRDTLIELIQRETANAVQGLPASIDAKVNSLVDKTVIDALYAASQAGVMVRLNVRGICCLRPGLKGVSENITVVSIIDRFLEHARILRVNNAGSPQLFISSADWMPRNLDRRIELLVPVLDQRCQQRFSELLDSAFEDRKKGRTIMADGGYAAPDPAVSGPSSQELLCQRAKENAAAKRRDKRTRFRPHTPQP